MLIDPDAFIGQSLRLRRIGQDDHAVVVAGRTAGRIMRKPVSGGGSVWFWTVTGPHLPPELQPSSGDAATLDDAKAAFKKQFTRWLEWAVSRGCDAHWHGGE